MILARSALLVSLCFLGACQPHARIEQPSASSSQPAREMPYGLSCDRCVYGHRQDCAWTHEAPIAAVISDIRLLKENRSCLAAPAPESPAVCSATRLYGFGHTEFLHNVASASSADLFEVSLGYPEVYTSNLDESQAEGPLLQPGRRYVIFAGPDRKDMGFAADWYINIACETDPATGTSRPRSGRDAPASIGSSLAHE